MTRQLERPCLGLWNPETHEVDPCGVPAVGPRCGPHQAAYDARRRPSPSRRGYDRRYRADRALTLAPDDLGRRRTCSIRLPGCTVWADTADHVVPVDGGRSEAGMRGPLRPSCRHCNSARGKRPIDAAVAGLDAAAAERAMAAEVLARYEEARDAALVDALLPAPDDEDEFWHPDP